MQMEVAVSLEADFARRMTQAHQNRSAFVQHQSSGQEQGYASGYKWIEDPRRKGAHHRARTHYQQRDCHAEAIHKASDEVLPGIQHSCEHAEVHASDCNRNGEDQWVAL